MVRISKMGYMNIYSDSNGSFIVHNTRKEFSIGHTHINNYKTAKYIAYLALYEKLPKNNHLSDYMNESVIRLSTNKEYISKIKKLRTKR